MKSKIFRSQISLTFLLVWICADGNTQTIWDGPYETFEKESSADWTLPENQDRITDLVWITRKNNQGIFNIATEGGYAMNESPAGTEWAMGTTDDIDALVFSDWRSAVNSNPLESLSQDMVLHLIEEDIYIDLIFQEWQQLAGGAFTYKRSTDPALSIEGQKGQKRAVLFPNPSQDFISLSENIGSIPYSIFDVYGKIVDQGEWDSSSRLDIGYLPSGMYTFQSNDLILRFVKRVN